MNKADRPSRRAEPSLEKSQLVLDLLDRMHEEEGNRKEARGDNDPLGDGERQTEMKRKKEARTEMREERDTQTTQHRNIT